MRRKVCALTGHRPKRLPWGYDEGDARCVRLKEAIGAQIKALSPAGGGHFRAAVVKYRKV